MDGDTMSIGDVLSDFSIEDAWLVDPGSGRSGPGSLRVEDGVIVELSWGASGGAATAPGDGGVVVAPGFLDLHASLREPGGEDAETYATGLAAPRTAASPRSAPRPDTRPTVDRPEVVQRVGAAAAAAGSAVRARTWAALTVGREGTTLGPLASLAAAGVVGFTDLPAATTDPALLRAALTEAGALGLPVVIHADEPALTAGAEANEGLPATILGLKGASPAAEVAAVARAVAVLRQVSAEMPPDVRPHLHLTGLSVGAALEPIRGARAEGLRVTCDVFPHHLTLHDGWLGGDARYAWEAASDPWSGQPAAAAPYDVNVRVDSAAALPGGRHRPAGGRRGRHDRCHRHAAPAGPRGGQGAAVREGDARHRGTRDHVGPGAGVGRGRPPGSRAGDAGTVRGSVPCPGRCTPRPRRALPAGGRHRGPRRVRPRRPLDGGACRAPIARRQHAVRRPPTAGAACCSRSPVAASRGWTSTRTEGARRTIPPGP